MIRWITMINGVNQGKVLIFKPRINKVKIDQITSRLSVIYPLNFI